MNGVPGYAGAIVNPTLTLAIESTRQFLKIKVLDELPLGEALLDPKLFGGWPGNLVPAVDDKDQLLRWQPDCRASVLAFEALSGMHFVTARDEVEPKNDAARDEVEPKKPGRAELWLSKSAKGKFSGDCLISMTRPELPVLVQQAARVVEQAKDRLMPKSEDVASRDRLTEITSQVVPPFAFWCAALPMHPDRMPRTIELIELTLTLASFVVQRFKHALAVPRPNQINAAVFPAILTPAHASLPSGHATEAFAVANVLLSLLYPGKDRQARCGSGLGKMLLGLAARIADNRQVAGLHYPIDTIAGRLLGTVLADYLVSRCSGGPCLSGEFNGADIRLDPKDGAVQVLTGSLRNEVVGVPDIRGQGLKVGNDGLCSLTDKQIETSKSDALSWLWERAGGEWGGSPNQS